MTQAQSSPDSSPQCPAGRGAECPVDDPGRYMWSPAPRVTAAVKRRSRRPTQSSSRVHGLWQWRARWPHESEEATSAATRQIKQDAQEEGLSPYGRLYPCPPPPPPILKEWAKISSGSLADQNFSLAPLAPINLDRQFFFSAPPHSQHHRREGGWTHLPTPLDPHPL